MNISSLEPKPMPLPNSCYHEGIPTQMCSCTASKNLIEIFAEIEHRRWANWQKYLHSVCIKNEDGSLTIPKKYVELWERQMNTPYKDLPTDEKVSSKLEANITLNFVDQYYAPKWIDKEEQSRGKC